MWKKIVMTLGVVGGLVIGAATVVPSFMVARAPIQHKPVADYIPDSGQGATESAPPLGSGVPYYDGAYSDGRSQTMYDGSGGGSSLYNTFAEGVGQGAPAPQPMQPDENNAPSGGAQWPAAQDTGSSSTPPWDIKGAETYLPAPKIAPAPAPAPVPVPILGSMMPIPPAPTPKMAKPPAAAGEPMDGSVVYKVWYGTNRKSIPTAALDKQYSDERDNVLHYGSTDVYIPKSHEFGSTGSSLFWRLVTATDDRMKIQSIAQLTSSECGRQIQDALKDSAPGSKQVLVYIHGYNVSFNEAALRAAQIGFDLKVPGVTAFYSWPSRGDADDYTRDEASIEASEQYMVQFLKTMAKDSGAEKVHILAHSMGNRGLLRSLQHMIASAEGEGIKFGQIFLAAPDMDADLFRQLAEVYPKMSERTTLYVSGADKAVRASTWFHGAARAGFVPPVTVVEGIDTVEATNVDIDLLGHSYYAEAEPMLQDMHALLQANTPPQQRLRLQQAATDKGEPYWVFAR